jgi:hypothetical protein
VRAVSISPATPVMVVFAISALLSRLLQLSSRNAKSAMSVGSSPGWYITMIAVQRYKHKSENTMPFPAELIKEVCILYRLLCIRVSYVYYI